MTNAQNTPWRSPPKVWAKLRSPAREMRRAATPEENLVWERVRSRRFHGLMFRRQHALGTFIVDFYCPEKHLIIEVDGDIHETSVEADVTRQEHLETLGFVVVRLKNDEVKEDLDRALSKVSTVLVNLPSPRAERGRG